MDQSFFDGDYYLRGVETGKSNYDDYRWMPELTGRFAQTLIDAYDPGRFLDFGCARGYLVRAMLERGVDAWGFDASEWAVENCDEQVETRVTSRWASVGGGFDLILAKDVFEHVPWGELERVIPQIMAKTDRLLVVVPLAAYDGGPFVYPQDEKDISHINRHNNAGWLVRLGAIWGKVRYAGMDDGQKSIIKPASGLWKGSTAFYHLENGA